MASPGADDSEDERADEGVAALLLYEPARVLICTRCKAAIRPGANIAPHFRKIHQIKGDELQRILDIARALAETAAGAGGLQDPHTAEVPADGSEPIQQLPVQAGFRCTACSYLTTSRKKILQHWTLERARLDAAHDSTSSWAEAALQSFSSARKLTRYWVVNAPILGRPGLGKGKPGEPAVAVAAPATVPDVGSSPGPGWATQIAIREAKVAAEEAERARTIDSTTGVDFESPWVRQMGWAAHLAGKDMVELWNTAKQGLSPKELAKLGWGARKEREASEGELVRLGQSFDREIARCSRRIGQVPEETLCWLASRDPQRPAPKPFSLKQEAATTERYQSYWRRYLCFCVRAFRLGRGEARGQYRIQFNDDQWAALEAIAGALDCTYKRSSRVGGDDSSKDKNDDDDRFLDAAVFTFCITSLTQQVLVRPYINPLLHFTTVLAIDPSQVRFRTADNFTSQLAGIVWCSRVLLLEYLFEEIPIQEDTGDEGGDADESDDQGSSQGVRKLQARDISVFMEGYRQWIADGTYSPFSTIIRFMTIGKGYRLKEGGTPRIIWEDGKKAVRLHGSRIEVQDFRRMAQGLVTSAESGLDRLLYGQSAGLLDRAEPGRINDSVIYEGDGRSFVTNPQNDWLRAGPRTVGELLSSKLWWPKKQQYHREKSQRWLNGLTALRGQLLLLTHIWGGQPGRGPEVTSVRYKDTQQLSRSIYIFDGQVMIVTDRDKAKSIRGYGRKVARFLPDRIGKLLIVYIVWLIPFEEMLIDEIQARKPSEPLRHWLWKDGRRGRWGTEVLTKELKAATASYLGVELGTAAYRHLAIELGRTIRGLVIQQQELEVGAADDGSGIEDGEVDEATGEPRHKARTELIWDLQATHSSAVARSRYAVNIQFPGQLQPQLIANYREISRLWHQYLGWDSQETREHRTRKRKRESTASQTTYEDAELPGRNDTTEFKPPSPKQRRPFPEAAGEVRRRIQQGLESLFGTGARWKSTEQEQAMVQTMQMRGGSVLIVVLPTGGGKSVLFMVPAVRGCHGGTSIVVVPFMALIDDLVARARSSGIDCVRWKSAEEAGREAGSLIRVAGLVVVSADQASSHEFYNYADTLRSRRLLRRIFIDECHTIITDVSYRQRLAALKGLYRYDCPVVLLTATLPVKLEGWFRQQMLAKDAEIIRARTTKRNIRYAITTVPGRPRGREQKQGDAVHNEVVRLIEDRTSSGTLEGGKRGIIYCRSKQDSERLAERIGCGYYHSGTGIRAREQVLEAWISGRAASPWITATTGLGTGIDIPGISIIIHAEEPYGLVDYVQQTGRGGRRDGEVVEATIVLTEEASTGQPKGQQQREAQETDVERANRLAMRQFVKGEGCRRAVLGRFMDGVEGENCIRIGAVQCDWCEGQAGGGKESAGDTTDSESSSDTEADSDTDDGTVGAANRLKAQQMEQQRRKEKLRGWLEEVEGESRCAVCYVQWRMIGSPAGSRRSWEHGMQRCRVIGKADYIRWRQELKFTEGSCCWRCGLGLEWCERAGRQESKEEGGERVDDIEEDCLGLGQGWRRRRQEECRWNDKVLPVLMYIQKESLLREIVVEGVEGGLPEVEEWRDWIVRPREVLGERMTNGLAVVEALIRNVY